MSMLISINSGQKEWANIVYYPVLEKYWEQLYSIIGETENYISTLKTQMLNNKTEI